MAGAQPKIALHQLAEGEWGIPHDTTPTTHILKPNSGVIRNIDVVEQLSMAAARCLDLNVAESTIENFGGVRTFVTKRYDRAQQDGRWIRLHQEDLCQALAVMPGKKYQRTDGGPGVGEIADLIESFPLLLDRRKVAREFFRGFVFNAVIGGTDAHAKNYSLLLAGESVELAPLYDLATFAPYRDAQEAVLLPMNVNGKYRLDQISTADFVKTGTRLRLQKADALEIVEQTRIGVVSAFETARDELVSARLIPEGVADTVVEAVRGLVR